MKGRNADIKIQPQLNDRIKFFVMKFGQNISKFYYLIDHSQSHFH